MNIIAVDDEAYALKALSRSINQVVDNAEVNCFSTSEDALEYAEKNKVDVAFLDIQLTDMHGLILTKKLKDINGNTNIVFVTGYSDYAKNAFEMHASGYVLKPIDSERILEELNNLRIPVEQKDEGLRIQCFGNFEVFYDGNPVMFKRPKSKELLAYLVDRHGAGVTKKELASILWEDEPYNHSIQSHLYILLTEMKTALEEVGVKDFVIVKRGYYAVDVSKVNCDFYNYEKGDPLAVNSYHGEYMTNYTWAEFTAGRLANK